MREWRSLLSWWPWSRRRQLEQDLEREIEAHLDLEAEEQHETGRPKDQARYAARRAFGNVTSAKEDVRAAWGWTALDQLVQDLRYTMRLLRRSRGFTAVAVACLALGIGANTAIFTLMNAVMLKSLPVEDPEQLVVMQYVAAKSVPREIRRTSSGYGRTSLPLGAFEQFRGASETLSSVFAFVPTGFNDHSLAVSVEGELSLAAGEMVSGSYFSGLGVTPILGRAIVEDDEKLDAPRVAVISYAYWSRRFARDPAVIGSSIGLNRMAFTIVGVIPPEFFGITTGLAPDIWVPLRDGLGIQPWGNQPPPGESLFADDGWWWAMIGGRRKPGVTEEQARAEIDVLFQRSITQGLSAPPPEELPHIELIPASGGMHLLRQRFSEPLWVLMTAVGLVLLIACANVATLLLARASAREKEMSVRLATGASRARLIRQLLTESIVLAAIGGALGLVLAQWASRVLLVLMSPVGQPLALDVRPDSTVLAFSASVCILTGMLFGLAPAFRATRVDLAGGLKTTAQASTPRLGLGKALIVGQVALSLLLLIGAGLFLRTLNNLANEDVGFDQHNLLLFALDARRDGSTQESLAAVYQRVLEDMQALPGVRSATASGLALLTGWMSNTGIKTNGPPLDPGESSNVYWNGVGPAFLETMGIPLVLGRDIEWSDTQGARKVIVVNEAMARHFFPDGNPLGHLVTVPRSPNPDESFEIVGVAANAKYDRMRSEPPRTLYVPYTSMAGTLGRLFFEIRTVGEPTAMIPAVREAVRRIDRDLPLVDVKTQSEQIQQSLSQERMFARLASFFAALALLLVAVGLYGTLSYAVTRRTNEIGIRMALGAQRFAVLWMVLRESLVLILAGAVIGLPLAFATTRFVESQLYGVQPNDVLTVSAAVLVLAAAGALASYLPARRAARVDPMVALRYE
jgi:predicted permease